MNHEQNIHGKYKKADISPITLVSGIKLNKQIITNVKKKSGDTTPYKSYEYSLCQLYVPHIRYSFKLKCLNILLYIISIYNLSVRFCI